jgi:hypothetical protein
MRRAVLPKITNTLCVRFPGPVFLRQSRKKMCQDAQYD